MSKSVVVLAICYRRLGNLVCESTFQGPAMLLYILSGDSFARVLFPVPHPCLGNMR